MFSIDKWLTTKIPQGNSHSAEHKKTELETPGEGRCFCKKQNTARWPLFLPQDQFSRTLGHARSQYAWVCLVPDSTIQKNILFDHHTTQQLRVCALLQRTQVWFPARLWKLTASYNPNSKGSDTLFWPSQASDTCVVHIYASKTFVHMK